MKHHSPLRFRLGGLLAALLFVLAGLPARAQSEAVRQATELAARTLPQWAGTELPATDFRISSASAEPSGLLYAYPQQLRAGIPVYNQVVTLVFKSGELRHHAGVFLAASAFAGQPAAPTVTAAAAVTTALASTGATTRERPAATGPAKGLEQQQTFAPAGVARRPIEARLVWATDKGTPRLAWNVNVDLLASPDWLNIRVDAATGQVLGKDNWTVHERMRRAAEPSAPARPTRQPQAQPQARPQAQPLHRPAATKSILTVTPASYIVVPLPGERPDVTAPTTDTNPWLRAGASNAATTHGWHFDGTTNFLDTRGNNVWAYDDSLQLNAPGRVATSTGTPSSLVFNYQPDFTKVATLGRNRRAATVNLFYWNNLMHDVMYQYGFTETAGNFQTDNLGRGGLGNDYVKAEAQDGGGINNANFSTPADGSSGRMQMYLFNFSTPGRDGDFDNGVITHEYGHGVSNRLTGGPANSSCLSNAEQAGEGWSDYIGLMMTTNWATAQITDGATPRPIGTYVLGQSPTAAGIRRFPYCTNMSVDPLTYADMALSTEVHNIGEIWCSTLWDLTWALIQKQGTIEPNLYNSLSTGGNAIALNLMMQGLKLQPCKPGFLDSRDAILAADNLYYNGQYHCLIESVFARRGMGRSARQGASTSATDQTPAFDTSALTLTKNTTPLVGSQFNLTITATCGCTPPSPVNITDQLPTDLQYLSSTGGTLAGSTVTFANQSFVLGQQRTYQIQGQTAPGKGCAFTTPINDDRDANTAGGLTGAVVTGANSWAVSTTRAYSATQSWMASDPATTSDVTLTSAPFAVTDFSNLSFYHYYNTELRYDGGMVAISVNNGAWVDAAPYFLQNGYNTTFTSPTASAGKPCFSGLSSTATGAAAFKRSVVDLSSFSGQSIRVRFQMQSDVSVVGEGWYLDDIQVQTGCGGFQLVKAFTNSNVVLDSYSQVIFLLPAPPPPTILSFTPGSGPVGTSVVLTGTNFVAPATVSFNGTAAAGVVINSATQITVPVPTGATTGPISVSTSSGTAASATSFHVLPTAVISSSAANPTNISPIPFSVTFSEAVTGFSLAGVTVGNGTAAGLSGSGTTYAFNVTPTANGPVTVGVPANAAQNGTSDGNVAATSLSITYQQASSNSVWTGFTNTDWFTASNWTSGVPTIGQDAIIGTSNFSRYPVIGGGAATSRDLVINTGGSLTMSGGTLDVRGDWLTNGPFTATAGTVLFGATPPANAPGPNVYGNQLTRFWNLNVQANGVRINSTAGGAVQRLLTLTGNLTTLGNPFTLQSSPTLTAMVVNSGGVVTGAVAVQRAISTGANAGLGYRHYASPVANTTVADLATTTGFTPMLNSAYNTSPTPSIVVPFPTVLGYDQSRLATVTSNYAPLDKGYFSPVALTDPLVVGRGYAVNLDGSQVVDFVGTLTNGDVALTLARNSGPTAADAGWQLLGNPYPSPLNYSLVTITDRPNLDAAIYVFESSGPYSGAYRSYVNGLGSPLLPLGQAFFVHVADGQTSGGLTFRNSQRPTAFLSPGFLRPAAETRPVVHLALRGATGPADDAYVYYQAGATAGADTEFDAEKLPNPTGLNLASEAAGRAFAINGLPLMGAGAAPVPLHVGVPATGAYTLEAAELLNLPAGLRAYLRDRQTGTVTDLTAQPRYAFIAGTTFTATRFELFLTPQVLATQLALAEQVALYPNPARTAVSVDLPAALGRTGAVVELVDVVGRVVLRQTLPAGPSTHTLRLTNLATGVYSLRLHAGADVVVKKLVIE